MSVAFRVQGKDGLQAYGRMQPLRRCEDLGSSRRPRFLAFLGDGYLPNPKPLSSQMRNSEISGKSLYTCRPEPEPSHGPRTVWRRHTTTHNSVAIIINILACLYCLFISISITSTT